MKPFFSFAVPCCDVEPYIAECLQSVLGQSFRDWECIIGIETSKDRTEEIVREMTAGDPRFKIFTSPRTGSCSASRNTGIDMAEGEYVIFLDGDDSIADGCLERLHEKICANPGADLYPCAIVANDEINGKSELRDNYLQDAPAEMNGIEATLYLENRLRGAFCPMLQLTVFRHGFLVEHDLKCIRGLRHQDSEFSPRALYLAKRVVPLHEPFYLYRIRTGSVQTVAKGADYFMKDWAVITRSLLAFYGKVSREDGFDARVVPCWIHQWLSRMNYKWFSPKVLKEIPRAKRAEWLKFIFRDGFDSFNRMMESGSHPQRMAAWFVCLFVRHPSMRWAAEFYFRCFFMLMERNNKEKNSFSKRIDQQEHPGMKQVCLEHPDLNPFFSIVVPCCNVEPYIEECLRSVLNQSFREWECILHIEASDDRTEEIIRKRTAGDPRFTIITGPKTGACSTGRNRGIDIAKGEYIVFLDGDDTIADGCLKRIHDKICATPGADLYPCAIVANDEINGKSELRNNYQADAPAEMNGIEATLYLGQKWHGHFCPMLPLTIYRKAFLLQNKLKCIPYLRHEDSEFSPRALFLAKRVVPIHEPYYLYRIRPNTISTKNDMGLYLKDRAIISKSLLAFYDSVSRENSFDTRVVPYWNRQWLSRMNYWFFSPKAQKGIPREKRVECLSFIFEDGFRSYNSMMKYGSFPQRTAAFFVRVFVRHPSLRWSSDLFFRFYFKHVYSGSKQFCTPISN